MSPAIRPYGAVLFASLMIAVGCTTTRPHERRSVEVSPPLHLEQGAAAPAPTRLTPAELAARARDAVVTLSAYRDGEIIQSGTGFFIQNDGVLVTNFHVVAGAESLSVELSDGEVFDAVYVLSKDTRRDLILLQIPVAEVTALTIADERGVQVGDAVYAIGNPLGLRGTFSDGLVSAKRVEDGVTYLQITAPISEGSSGGPVMNERGEVIGVATAFYEDGQNLNMAIPARHARGMLQLAPSPTPFETVASELKTDEQKLIESRADESRELMDVLPRETLASLQDLDEYGQQVAVRALVITAVAADEGWTYLDQFGSAGALEPDEMEGGYVSLGPGHYMAVGVCDDDCIDLDLIVMDSAEELVGVDAEVNPEAFVQFDVGYRQQYWVGVNMYECAAPDCLYTILMFRKD
ncbi:trypsin-like peptidase domain-containing protein [Thioalkalivibrio sp. XN8]|uniref:S1C family serine protease n=1 Tax=Thioalkalivibrio sp. XN8 TaxID=2712863 RepID=UPI0013EAE2EE|nr:trypsin-like peptidase domain-containing protein [Thioalkalivibrio sp. XN8]NGP53588.1 trypsin-like serine protease [Thioalkalivibrio sp. XN8]